MSEPMSKEELFNEIEWMDPGDSITITAGTSEDWNYTIVRPLLEES